VSEVVHAPLFALSGYAGHMAVTAVLVEDNLIVREGIATLLGDAATGVDLLATCEDADELLENVDTLAPDVVVTDIRMPPTFTDEGIRLAETLRDRRPGTGVVILSSYADPEYALTLLEAGVEGRACILKERVHDRAQLVTAIHSVAMGGSVIDPQVIALLVRKTAERLPLSQLTSREREVLAQIAEGRSNAAIAESLVLTKRAVEKHINSIFMKLDLSHADDVSKRVKATLMYLAAS
jgi:DNA-binding NarL/FixJ family response regulator